MTGKTLLLVVAAAALTLAGIGAGAAPAAAAIQCDGNYQIVQGRPISTPYCRDTHLAQVANEYGIRVTANQMRWNPSEKARVCRMIGHDNRVFEACTGYRPDTDRHHWVP